MTYKHSHWALGRNQNYSYHQCESIVILSRKNSMMSFVKTSLEWDRDCGESFVLSTLSSRQLPPPKAAIASLE